MFPLQHDSHISCRCGFFFGMADLGQISYRELENFWCGTIVADSPPGIRRFTCAAFQCCIFVILNYSQMIILMTASCVKLRNWRRDIRLEKVAEEEQIERGEVTLAGRLSADIPFGIRALAEDPEVEGVWNPRAVTALHYNSAQSGHSNTSLRPSKRSRKDPSTSSTSLHKPADPGFSSPNGKVAVAALCDSANSFKPCSLLWTWVGGKRSKKCHSHERQEKRW